MFSRFINLLKIHPKKSIFFASVSAACANYVNKKYREELLRHSLCFSLSDLGREKLPKDKSLYRVTVFLNPFAYQRRLLEAFDRNAGPLLHLAGLDVQMVYLDDDNEVKGFVNVIDPSSTDAIVVAGDDGLLAKSVTGLLRRQDFLSARLWDIPVYVLPLGVWNNFARSYTYETDLVSWCFKLVEPIIYKQSGRRNVIEIKPISHNEGGHQQPVPDVVTEKASKQSTDNDAAGSKSVFAMSGMEWSCWRDAEYGGGGFSLTASRMSSHKPRIPSEFTWWSLSQCSKRLGAFIRHSWYWLRSPVPATVTEKNVDTFFADSDNVPQKQPKTLFGKPKPIRRPMIKQGKIVMTYACPGCSKCWPSKNRLAAPVQPTPPAYTATRFGRLFSLTPYKSPASNGSASKPVVKNSKAEGQNSDADRENPLCGTETTLLLSHATRIAFIPDQDNIRVSVSPAARGMVAHLRQMFRYLLSPAYFAPEVQTSQMPEEAASFNEKETELSFLASSVKFYPARTDGEFFWIDNDSFEACPVELTVLRNAIKSLPVAQSEVNKPAVL